MMAYLTEFALIHSVFMLGYWLILRKENQFGKRRFYLLASTTLALTIPVVRLPRLFDFSRSQAVTELPIYVTPTEGLIITETSQQGFDITTIFLVLYACISTLLLVRFLWGLTQLIRMRMESAPLALGTTPYLIRVIPNLESSFSFFGWIFMNPETRTPSTEQELILKHEEAHVRLGHSYDLVFCELVQVAFWWVPTAWYALKEIKEIHEYQADAYVLRSHGLDQYSTTLINTTLKSHGLSLASSFDDSLIIKRIQAMKEKVTKISRWKIGLLTGLCALVFVLFACTEERTNDELNEIVSQSDDASAEVFTVVQEHPSFKGGMDGFYKYLMQEMRYPRQAREEKVEGIVQVEFVVERDGKITNVKAIKGIGSGCDEEAVRVLENAPDFIPGSQRGRTVRVRMQMPISFKLNHEKLNPDNTTQGNVVIGEVATDNEKMKIEASVKNGAWSGTILTADGKPLPGVNIYINGTQRGTVTDLDGSFSLKIDANETVTVSFVGYESTEITFPR